MLAGPTCKVPVTMYRKAAEQSCSVECRALTLVVLVRHVQVQQDWWAAMLAGLTCKVPVTKYSKAVEQSCSVECRALILIGVVGHV
jgi:hypothetical protein